MMLEAPGGVDRSGDRGLPRAIRRGPSYGIRENMKTPLDGIRVIDWTIWQQGPFATALLGDLGAEVIKLETPDGDPGRSIFAVSGSTTARNGKNFYFESNNRHKQSITLDLKKPEAREIVYQLLAKRDG